VTDSDDLDEAADAARSGKKPHRHKWLPIHLVMQQRTMPTGAVVDSHALYGAKLWIVCMGCDSYSFRLLKWASVEPPAESRGAAQGGAVPTTVEPVASVKVGDRSIMFVEEVPEGFLPMTIVREALASRRFDDDTIVCETTEAPPPSPSREPAPSPRSAPVPTAAGPPSSSAVKCGHAPFPCKNSACICPCSACPMPPSSCPHGATAATCLACMAAETPAEGTGWSVRPSVEESYGW